MPERPHIETSKDGQLKINGKMRREENADNLQIQARSQDLVARQTGRGEKASSNTHFLQPGGTERWGSPAGGVAREQIVSRSAGA